MSDRTIHASAGEWLIVRYNRAGKWYIEYEPPRGRSCQHIKVDDAARIAVDWEEVAAGTIYLRAPGGNRFDFLVRKWQAARNDGEDAQATKGKA